MSDETQAGARVSKKRRELESEIARLQAELEEMKCRVYVQAHLLNGATCALDKDGHKWHKTTVYYRSMSAGFEIQVKWKITEIEPEIEDE
jgi:hypothetical protein